MGCVCGQNKIFMDGDKISAIIDMPEPKNTQAEVRSFLGAVGFYRRWISNYSEMAQPLVELLKGKDKKIKSPVCGPNGKSMQYGTSRGPSLSIRF